jgi:hypothetical protein
MANGTVKDPEGHQSKPYDFGYIQRLDDDPPRWPDHYIEDKKRAIPYLNRRDLGEEPRLHNPPDVDNNVEFVVREAVVCQKVTNGGVTTYTEVGTIGIAICTVPDRQQRLMDLFPNPPHPLEETNTSF